MNGIISKLPDIEVSDITQATLWENASYIPVLSNAKGATNVLIGTIELVCSVFASMFILIVLVPVGIFKDLKGGLPVFGPAPGPNQIWSPGSFSTFFAKSAYNVLVDLGGDGITTIARGILESIPVAGNLALGFWDGKIKIIPK